MIQELAGIDVLEKASDLINKKDAKALALLLESLPSKELVHLISHLNQEHQSQLFTLLSPENAADLMDEIPDVQAIGIIEGLQVEDAAAILHEMESDEQTDLIMGLDAEDAEAILDQMGSEEADNIRNLLSYPADTAGGLMHTEFLCFQKDQTIGEITEKLRNKGSEYQNYQLKHIFVTDENQVLVGVLKMQDLLLGQSDNHLADIIIEEVFSIDHRAEMDEIIEIFQKHPFIGLPVVDEAQTLLGVILKIDIAEAQAERITQEHLESQGIIGGDELRTMPVTLRARRRLSWLSVNILLNILAASVIAYHQDVLSSVIAMAVFLPIISDMSGCSGNQAVAVSMRELSIGAVTPREVFRVLGQEISVGLINGVALGILIGLAAFIWKGNIYLGLVVGSALTINTLFAVSIGGTVPLILKGFDIDPALASGPILTTITDMLGFFLALTFAAMVLGHIQGL